MATNSNTPFGFREIGLQDGSVPNMGVRTGLIAQANANKIFYGDVLKPVAPGYLDVAAVVPGGEPVGGVAIGFSWLSKSTGYRVFRPYWPGTGANEAAGDITVNYLANPGQILQVQCLLGPVTKASIGKRCNFAVGAGGNTANGISSFSLDDGTIAADSPSSPFKIYGLPGGSGENTLTVLPGDDTSNPYNIVFVEFNNLVA